LLYTIIRLRQEQEEFVQHLRIAKLLLFGMLLSGGKAAIADYSFIAIDVPGAVSPGGTHASGINDSGQIVGTYNNFRSFLYSGGSFTPIDVRRRDQRQRPDRGVLPRCVLFLPWLPGYAHSRS
jgi:hypothetical protein